MKIQNIKVNEWVEKIELGTAQFGMDYGVNNGVKVSQQQACLIHEILYGHSAFQIDTAPSYGDSEKVVSGILKQKSEVNTKVLPLSKYSINEVLNAIDQSKNIFGDNLTGIMIHDSSDIFSNHFPRIVDHIKSYELKVGVSLYTPSEIYKISDVCEMNMIQIPFNLLDQRADDSYFIEHIKKFNIECHIRSVFLQGLLLMRDDIPTSLSEVTPYLDLIYKEAYLQKLTIYEMCLLFVFKQSWIDKVVIGLDNNEQAELLINTLKKISVIDTDCNFSMLACSNSNLVNPAKWNYDC